MINPTIKRFPAPLPSEVTDLLVDLYEYMESRADADFFFPNEEMGFQGQIRDVLWQSSGKDIYYVKDKSDL